MKHIYIDNHSKKTFLTLHGTGADENDLVPLVRYLDPSYNILSPRGNVSENGMNRFFKRYGMGNYDIDNLVLETSHLKLFIEKATLNYDIDANQIVGLGFSNGANILESLIQLYGKVLNKVVLLSPVFLQPNVEFKSLKGIEIFVATSDLDPYVKNNENHLLIAKLKDAGAHVYVYQHNFGHQINQTVLDDLKKWLNK